MSGFDGFFDRSTGGGNFLPIVKYDARAGRMARVDRVDGENTSVDITNNFKAVFDFENVEIGYIRIAAGSAPDFKVSRYYDKRPIADPKGEYKAGVRFVVKLGKDCGGDVRELASTAGAFLEAAKHLHVEYEKGIVSNPGKLPVVALNGVKPRTTGEGAKKSTNYEPEFKIISWVARPVDLTYTPRGSADVAEESSASASTPPATGSSRAAPPATAMATAEEDFG